MTEIKNILLVGLKGKGKTVLANVLSGRENALRESDSNINDIQTVDFEVRNEKYRIIDTVGINNEELKIGQILRMIGKGYKKVGNGLSQILFVVREKFLSEEIDLFNILRTVLFDERVTNYISIVWTDFGDFEEESECKKNTQSLFEENNEEVVEIIDLCGKRIIYVDNPMINISGVGKRVEKRIEFNKETRQSSRKILLEHLKKWQEIYEPENFAKIDNRIDDYAKKHLDKRIKTLKKEIESKEQLLAIKVKKLEEETEKKIKVIREKMEKLTEEKREMMSFLESFSESFMEVKKCNVL